MNPSKSAGPVQSPGPAKSSYSFEYPPELTRHQRRFIYAAQVRAFIEASEVVDADEETLQDILDGSIIPGDEVDDAWLSDDDGDVDPFGYKEWSPPMWTDSAVSSMLRVLKTRGMAAFLKLWVVEQAVPIPELLCAFGLVLCEELHKKKQTTLLYFLRVALYKELQIRERLTEYNTIDDAVDLIKTSKRILILTGAGISVSCGIPDFRSRNGLYATLKDKGDYDLDDPQQMFDITYFKENPSVFYSFARQIYPSNFIPSPCHRFIKTVEDRGKLLRNYTQNIDTLETLAGVQNVLQCHGSFATAICLQCRVRVRGTEIEKEILSGEVPLCPLCNTPDAVKKAARPRRKRGKKGDSEDEDDVPLYPPWIMKPEITFFGEKLTDSFELALEKDKTKVDLLLVIGTSLKVSPVSEILMDIPHDVPQILINKTPVRHINPDIVLLGNADPIVEHLCMRLGWTLPSPSTPAGQNLQPPSSNRKRRSAEPGPQRVGRSHIWLFEGAEGGKWLEDLEAAQGEPSIESSSEFGSPSRDVKKPRVK